MPKSVKARKRLYIKASGDKKGCSETEQPENHNVIFCLFFDLFRAQGEHDNMKYQLSRGDCKKDSKIERVVRFERRCDAEARREESHHQRIEQAHEVIVEEAHHQRIGGAHERNRPEHRSDDKRTLVHALENNIDKRREQEQTSRCKAGLSAALAVHHMRKIENDGKYFVYIVPQNSFSARIYACDAEGNIFADINAAVFGGDIK